MTTIPNPPTAKQRASSLDVVTNPATYCAAPILFADAWEALKADRGQSVDTDRIGAPAHLVTISDDRDEDARRARIRRRVRRHADAMGYPLRTDKTGPVAS